MKKINFIVERTKTGYSAYSENFETFPVGSLGDTISDLKKNILEAANLWLDYENKKQIAAEQIKLSFDLQSFFEFYGIINATSLSQRIGMNNTLLSQYVHGIKKPSKKQTEKILTGLKQVGKELSELELV
ncbi:MAG TPA: hypothetical protein VGI43_16520 [Mucilaginibacter sp.]|jgi:predicted RNase H-like HicB family nuclease